MSRAAKEHILTTDNDGHWYVVEVGSIEAFDDWVACMEDDDPDPQLAQPTMPKGVEAVGGSPTLVKFKTYYID